MNMRSTPAPVRNEALVSALKRNSLDDGPGIRTTVFFSGCPLSCVWCQNPESMSASQKIVYEAESCIGCLRCAASCDIKAINMNANGNIADGMIADGTYPVDRKKCLLYTGGSCGKCVSSCRTGAMSLSGTYYDVDQLFQKLLIDAVFYKNSGGGVTFSGGEPTVHMEFLSGLAKKLKEKGIHLCLQTCGFYDHGQFEELLLPYLDLVYFDIKLFDREKHKKYCGVYNDSILQNFETLFRSRKIKVLPRIPLIPGITSDPENLTAIRGFFQKCGAEEIGLLPYNPLWLSKLAGLGEEAEYKNAEWMKAEEKNKVKEMYIDFKFRDF